MNALSSLNLFMYHLNRQIPTQLLIGVCVPDSCIGMDVLTIINTAHIIPYLTNVYVTQVKCIEERPLVTGTIVMFVIIGILTLLMVAATVYDVIITYIINRQSDSDELPITLQDGGNTDDVTSLLNSSPRTKQYTYQPGVGGECLLAFSVLTNGGKILDATHSSGTLAAIHGIRVLSMWWVILGHTFSLFNTLSDNSSAYSQEVLPRFTFQAILNAAFSVDSFFFLSGLLVTYLTLRELTEGKDVNWFMFYFHRFWRLTPLYMFIVFFNVYIFPYFIDGPYAAYVTTTENACIQHWWTNLLYINNLVPWPGKLADQCYGVSWYLANDMQFHVISPIIIILLYKIPIAGYVTMVVAMAACLASRIGISIHRDLTASFDKAFAGDKLLFISSDYYYTKPWTRISTYLVGMAVGYLLVKTKCKLRINIFINLVFWAAAWAIALAVLYGLYGTLHNHPLSTPVDVMYMTLCRVAWGVALGWLTFACLTGNGGPINAILSWKAWIPISRLTYCAYLTHIMVLQAYAMNQDRLLHLSDLNEVYMYIGTVVITYGVSFVVSLMAEAPMMRLEKVLKKTVNNLMARV
ncbi:nose resistant to fluoxetine protein 6-like [Glandiceps talaboti]